MPGPLDDNDYVENQTRGSRGGGRGGQGGGPGGTYYGASGVGGYGYAGSPGGYGMTPAVRKLLVPGASGPVAVQTARNSLAPQGVPMYAPGMTSRPDLGGTTMGKTGPGALNQAQPAAPGGPFGRRFQNLIGNIQQQQQNNAPGMTGWSPENRLEAYQTRGDWQALMSYLTSLYQQNGSFSPEGSRAILSGLEDQASRQSNQARQRAQLSADVMGLDPASAAALKLRTDLGSNTDRNAMLANASMQQLLSRQNFGDEGYMTMLRHSLGWDSADQAAALQRRGMDHQAGTGNWFGDISGLLGAGLGGWAGGGFQMPGGGRSRPAG